MAEMQYRCHLEATVVKKAKSLLAEAQDAAVAVQNELLALGWPTSAEVGRANGSQLDGPTQWAKDKRDTGELLGVWSPAENAGRHPDFQFLPNGHLNPRVKELLNALALHPDLKSDGDRGVAGTVPSGCMVRHRA